ncbi:hypothetical protein [Sigmofec virus UA08Rod_5092]|uniref:Uncharacterized protein n=1 Tax=Sigmofec virus UA08Rod_5092 TaxID=2929415 RepID=A0A976N1F5_9VIRU|nr:hypothetical protein [Sigmofec virus UA08Rod_5092]
MRDDKKPVPSQLLKQNCFLRDVARLIDVDTVGILTYESLDEVTTEDGIVLKRSVEDYPITPDYVNSFADTADYHNDPQGAILRAPKRVNLGDVTELQRVSGMDSEQMRALAKQIQERFGQAQAQAQAQASAPVETKKEGE